MQYHLKLPVPPTFLWPTFGKVLGESMHFHSYKAQSSHHTSSLFLYVSSFTRLQSIKALKISTDIQETSEKYCSTDVLEEQKVNEDIYFGIFPKYSESDVERERRRKIGLANKGKVPWNKGKKHSAETRAKIKQRTIEALKDPQVKTKMCGNMRPHSEQSKSKIGSSLRRVWEKRFIISRIREKFYLAWASSIANAAKKGGIYEKDLEWDSYDKLRDELVHQKLNRVKEKAKAAKVRAEKTAQIKTDKMAKRMGKVSETTRTKSREEKVELESAQELTLKERLTKIHKKKSINVHKQGESINSHIPTWQQIDMEIIKREKTQKEISLADQIRAAKNRKDANASLGIYSVEKNET